MTSNSATKNSVTASDRVSPRPGATAVALLRRFIRRVYKRDPLATDRALRDIAFIAATKNFDEQWYLQRYPDVAASGLDPIEHYVRHGAAEARDPCPGFNTKLYLYENPVVAVSGVNPFRHYLEQGEGNGNPASKVWKQDTSVMRRRNFRVSTHHGLQTIRRILTRTRGVAEADKSVHKDLLSIVVPAYNSERYIGECLRSLLAQTYQNIEILVIVDGATDRTYEIAQEYQSKDNRVNVHFQENAGPGAARNTGMASTHGEFLWFVDSDDLLPIDAAEAMVRCLQKSGSDFVVGRYNRFNAAKSWAAGNWIITAHSKLRLGVTLVQFPHILVNAMACSKVYRRSFWVKNVFAFPVGTFYEDQPLSAEVYARATAFDVLDRTIYNWRAREDRTSTTQQTWQLTDLDARWFASKESLAVLDRLTSRAVVVHRAVQFLKNDLQWSMVHLKHADNEFWQHLSQYIAAVAKYVPISRWREIPAHHAALEWLLLRKDFDRAKEYVERNGQYPRELTATRRGNDLVLKVPYWDDAEVAFPAEVIALSQDQIKPVVALRAGHWERRGVLVIEGWAYLSLVEPELVKNPAMLTLVSSERNPHVVSVRLERFSDQDIDRVSAHQLNDYRPFGFRAVMDVDALGLRPHSTYAMNFEFLVGSMHVATSQVQSHRWGSMGNLGPSTSLREVTARFVQEGGRATLRLRRPRVTTTRCEVADGSVIIELQSDEDIRGVRFTPLEAEEGQPVMAGEMMIPVQPLREGSYLLMLSHGNVPRWPARRWWLRALDDHSRPHEIDWPDAGDAPMEVFSPEGASSFVVFRSKSGNLGFMKSALTARAHVEAIERTGDAFKLTGRIIGNVIPTTACLKDHRSNTECRLLVGSGGRSFEVWVPWVQERWERRVPLSTGRYELILANETQRVAVTLSEAAGDRLPLWLEERATAVGWLEWEPRTSQLWLIVQATLAPTERGARMHRAFIDDHIGGVHVVDEGAVLFRTYYGESATDSALAIHNELQRRGSNLRLYWTVKDTSVTVPTGGIPVVGNSMQWFKLLSEAKYIVENMHQPVFFHKRPGQVLLATFHGYPFKMAGVPLWEAMRLPAERIAGYLQRQQQWDYLLSPAPYATPILGRVFPTPAEILEVGYPRNDIFFDAKKASVREHTRALLRITREKVVVLYAPTYRDYAALDDFRAPLLDFMDTQRVSDLLGDDYVLLIRGHAFNARTSERLEGTDDRVIDVTDYPEISDLCLASDVAVLDYSSLRFDYALTGKPMIFLVPDLERYHDGRGWLVPYEETAPGPLVRTGEMVVEWIRRLPALQDQYAGAREDFVKKYMPLEDGHSSRRLVDAMFSSKSRPDGANSIASRIASTDSDVMTSSAHSHEDTNCAADSDNEAPSTHDVTQRFDG